jgi:hypothetical protein
VCGSQGATGAACGQSKCVLACSPGLAHCSSNDGDGCETDTTKDAANCGSCGHDCGVETCTGGQCVPTVVAAGSSPVDVAVDATNVYFTTTDGQVLRAPIAGGVPTMLARVPGASYLTVDAQNVYFGVFMPLTQGGAVERVPIAGGQPAVPLTPSGANWPNEVVVQGGMVYFAAQGDSNMSNGYVASVPAGGGMVTVLAQNQVGPEQLAVDAANVYFTNFDYGGNTVMTAPLGGGPATVLAQMGLGSPFGIVIGGSSVYVFDRANGAIYQLPTGAAPDGGVTLPPPICTDPGGGNNSQGTGNLVTDTTRVYWVNALTGNVFACPLDGTNQVTPLVTGLSNPGGLARDAKSIYVCDTGNYRVLRVNK